MRRTTTALSTSLHPNRARSLPARTTHLPSQTAPPTNHAPKDHSDPTTPTFGIQISHTTEFYHTPITGPSRMLPSHRPTTPLIAAIHIKPKTQPQFQQTKTTPNDFRSTDNPQPTTPKSNGRKSQQTYTLSKPVQLCQHPPNMSQFIYPHQPSIEDQYVEFRQQVATQTLPFHNEPPSHQPLQAHEVEAEEDLDIDTQLENVSPEKGNSSLQMSLGKHYIQTTSHKSVHISENTPTTLQYRNLRMEDASESQTTKRRKADDYTATLTPPIPSKNISSSTHMRIKKKSTLSIDMIGQMWLDFHMHESLSI